MALGFGEVARALRELIAALDRRVSGAVTRRLEPFSLDVLELTQY